MHSKILFASVVVLVGLVTVGINWPEQKPKWFLETQKRDAEAKIFMCKFVPQWSKACYEQGGNFERCDGLEILNKWNCDGKG